MDDHAHTPLWRSRGGVALIGFGLIAAFYVLREHYGHALGMLPYLLLLACPAMHLLMHHGHGGHHHGASAGKEERRGPATGQSAKGAS